MIFDLRAILLFGSNVTLLYVTLIVNSALSIWSIYLLLLGPMIVFPALYLRHRHYLICTLCTGLWCDAALPSPYGFFTILFLITGACIFQLRIRFRAEQNYHPILLSHGVNFLFIITVSIYLTASHLFNVRFLIHLLVIAAISHFMLLIVAPWFFNFQRMLFTFFNLDTDPEDYPVV